LTLKRDWTRRRPTPANLVGLALLSSIFAKSMAERLSEHDLWWHLKAGQLIVASHHLPAIDPFSFTTMGKRWVIQQWGSEVILRGIAAVFGLRGIILWRSVMLLCIYGVVAWLFVRVGGNSLGTWAIASLAAYAGAPFWVERPTLFSLLIFAVVFQLVVRRSPQVWLCIPLFLLWANLHALVILGLGFMILVSGTETFKNALGTGDHKWARRLSVVTLGCLAASLVNPYGPKLLVYAVGLTHTVSSTAAEWSSPDFHQVLFLPFLLLVLLTFVVLALSSERPDSTDVVMMAAFLGLGLYAERNLPFSAIVLGFVAVKYAPAFARAAVDKKDERPDKPTSVPFVPAMAIIIAIALGLGALVWHRFPKSDSLQAVSDQGFPVATIASIPSSGVRLFIDDRWAGLAIYMRWPGAHVAFDGRGDLYGKEIIARYNQTISGGPGWESWLNQICATHVLIQEGGGLANVIEGSRDWRVLRRDPIAGGQAVLLSGNRPSPGCPR
jgi:hypothetical protein